MTAALTTFIADPWFDVLAAIFAGYFVLCAYVTARMVRDRSRHIDAVVNFHDNRPTLADQIADFERRIAEARRKDRDALIEALGLDGRGGAA